MSEDHQGSIKQYINDVIGMERDICNAIRGQLEDDRLSFHPDLKAVLAEIATRGESRLKRFKELSEQENASLGAVLKESVTAITGVLAGIYDRMREHPVSRILRDDIVATTVQATSYAMLLTLGLATNHTAVASLAEEGLQQSAGFTMKLSDFLPLIVASELARDAPLANPAAAQLAEGKMKQAWSRS